MKTAACLTLLLPLAQAAPLTFLIGTNTGGKSESKGIYAATFDPETGAFGESRLVAETDNPGFLALHPGQPFVYATGSRSVSGFRYQPDGSLELINRVDAGDTGACHLEVHPSGKGLAAANYNGGSVSTFLLDESGKLSEPFVAKHSGSSVHPQRQKAPHAHGIHFQGDLMLVPDLGIDQVVAYRFSPAEGIEPKPAEPAFTRTEAGGGPRHAAFHPNGRHVFVNHELTAKLESFAISGEELKSLDLEPTLPADWDGMISTAEVAVHPNGRWVFVSNRGHDSISVFAFEEATGALERKAIVPCGGKIPRHFTLTPDGGWLLVGGQNSNSLHAMRFNAETGELTLTDALIETPSPICLQFLPTRPE